VGVEEKFMCKNVTKQMQHLHCDISDNAELRGGHSSAWRRSHCQHARAVRSQ